MDAIKLILQLLFVSGLMGMCYVTWLNIYHEHIKPLLPISHKRHCRKALRDMASDLRRSGL